MRLLPILCCLFCLLALPALPCRGESILGGLENFGESLNRWNEDILDRLNGVSRREAYDERMDYYRRLETARVDEMSEATGVDPYEIRRLRSEGATWGQIADLYGVDLNELPDPLPLDD